MTSDALETMSLYGPAGSETTSDLGRRVESITGALEAMGLNEQQVMLAVRIEYRKVELSEIWQEEMQREHSIEGIKEWAARRFLELEFVEAMPEDEFEVTVRVHYTPLEGRLV